MQTKEVSKSNTVFFKQSSGKGSVVITENGKAYFMPALDKTRLQGEKMPIAFGESFSYVGHKVLNSGPGFRQIRIELIRENDSQLFYLEEHFFKKYFGVL